MLTLIYRTLRHAPRQSGLLICATALCHWAAARAQNAGLDQTLRHIAAGVVILLVAAPPVAMLQLLLDLLRQGGRRNTVITILRLPLLIGATYCCWGVAAMGALVCFWDPEAMQALLPPKSIAALLAAGTLLWIVVGIPMDAVTDPDPPSHSTPGEPP